MEKIGLCNRTKKRRINDEMLAYSSSQTSNYNINNSSSEDDLKKSLRKLPIQNNSLKLSNDINNLNNDSDNTFFNSIYAENYPDHPGENKSVDNESLSNSLNDNDFQPNDYTPQTICSALAQWAVENNISQISLNGLLLILRKHKCFITLPKDSRTVLQTKSLQLSKIRDVEPGKYYHFGIKEGIIRHFSPRDISSRNIKLVIGIDGLPISKSTSVQFWPILGYVRPRHDNVFPIGLYCGTEKPLDSCIFLKDFVTEAKNIISSGIQISNRLYTVTLDVVCCDAPAKAFILKIKGHNGFSSCTRCEIEGEYKDNRMCFPYSGMLKQEPKRTHNNYIDRSDVNFHTSPYNSCIVEIPDLNVVTSFSLDYMHLVTLGVMKKLLILWMKGSLNIRLPSSKISLLSNLILSLKSDFACEFSRKLRKLEDVPRWKATEFRTFLLYVGPVVLKNIISDDCYKHFMALNIAMIILLSPDHSSLIQYAENLLHYFVQTFEQIYGQYLVSHNIHGLLHLIDDFNQYGPLDNCSTFPFENYMKVLKSMLRKPHKPLEQVIMRYNESQNVKKKKHDHSDDGLLIGSHNNGPLLNNLVNPQFSTLILNNFKIKSKVGADSYFLSKDNDIIKLVNIAHSCDTGSVVLIGKKFEFKEDFYSEPIKSSCFGIYIVKKLSPFLNCWSVDDVKKKVMILSSCNNSSIIAMPLLHSN